MSLISKHKQRSLVFKTLDILPSRLGNSLYHLFQKMTLKDVSFYVKTNSKSLATIERILQQNDIDLENASVLEIGSGWFPIMPYLMKLNLKIKRFTTFDINKHFTPARIETTSTFFSSKDSTINISKKLPDFVTYYPNLDIVNASLDSDIDLVFSRFVLEHIPPEKLLEIHEHLFQQTDDQIKILHLISPSDHRSYSDGTLSTYDFLKYSKKEWNSIQTSFDYHNRLRIKDYVSIFEQAGFTVAYIESEKVDKASKKYKMFKDLDIHEDFKSYTEEELLASSINVLLTK